MKRSYTKMPPLSSVNIELIKSGYKKSYKDEDIVKALMDSDIRYSILPAQAISRLIRRKVTELFKSGDLSKKSKGLAVKSDFIPCFIASYNNPQVPVESIGKLFGLNETQVRQSAHILKKRGHEIVRLKNKGDKLTSGADLDYKNRPAKRHFESLALSCIKSKGGFFGLTGHMLAKHWEDFRHIMNRESDFTVVEQNKKLYKQLCIEANELANEDRLANNIRIMEGNIFSAMKEIPFLGQPEFKYCHLDFCVTARTMMRDQNLKEELTWMASWPHLKNTSYIDVTFATRGDTEREHIDVIEYMIPDIFHKADWKVTSPMQQYTGDSNYIVSYKDGCNMVRALYKMKRT